MASRRSRERANARPCEHEPDEPEHDDTERCPNTGDFESTPEISPSAAELAITSATDALLIEFPPT